MAKAPPDDNNAALNWLTDILERALDAQADAVTLEIEREGLEYTAFRGNSGIGSCLCDRDFGWKIVQLIGKKAKVRMNFDGKITLTLHGKKQTLQVRRYDVFGEPGFELRFKGEMMHDIPEW